MDYGLYFHIPFCVKKCIYCDFLSFPSFTVPAEEKEKYFGALRDEWFLKSERIDGGVDSIYIGGGTPSCVDPLIIYELIKCVRAVKPIRDYAEITVEINPGTATWDHFEIYRQAGVNRVSIGVQSTPGSAASGARQDPQRALTARRRFEWQGKRALKTSAAT